MQVSADPRQGKGNVGSIDERDRVHHQCHGDNSNPAWGHASRANLVLRFRSSRLQLYVGRSLHRRM